MEILKVSGKSVPKSVAGAIAQVLRREPTVTLQAVGPDAVNQAVKSIAIARSYLVDDRLDVLALPCFEKIEIDGMTRTAIKFNLERREVAAPTEAASASPVKPAGTASSLDPVEDAADSDETELPAVSGIPSL